MDAFNEESLVPKRIEQVFYKKRPKILGWSNLRNKWWYILHCRFKLNLINSNIELKWDLNWCTVLVERTDSCNHRDAHRKRFSFSINRKVSTSFHSSFIPIKKTFSVYNFNSFESWQSKRQSPANNFLMLFPKQLHVDLSLPFPIHCNLVIFSLKCL